MVVMLLVELIDGAEWLAREGADLAVSIGSAAWEGAQGIAGAVKNVASNANPVYFGAGVANGVMRGAMDSDPANDNKRNLITGAIMGTALARGTIRVPRRQFRLQLGI